MKVCVVGLGYIGFPTACLVAKAGHNVLGVDINKPLVDGLKAGSLHIVNEAGLSELAESVLKTGKLRVSTVPEPADVFTIAVPTPFRHGERETTVAEELENPTTKYLADLTFVELATRSIAPFIRPGNLVVLESTVPPGSTERVVVRTLREEGIDVSNILFAHAPERVLPGNIVHELVHNNRIVGGLTQEAAKAAQEFYRTFVQGQVVVAGATTAELVKLMENTFRDVNIALANEFAQVCEHLDVDVWEAIRLANLHPRVNFLRPGPGVGGHCIAVDPYFVIEAAPTLTPLIQAARGVNRSMPLHVCELYAQLTKDLVVRKVVVLGASYKANVGDDRESPSVVVAQLLKETGVAVVIHDPYVKRYNQPVEAVVAGADVILLLTDHQVYKELNPGEMAKLVSGRLLLDARGHLDAVEWRKAGFRVVRLGSGATSEVAVGV